jgi:hypothetical protein
MLTLIFFATYGAAACSIYALALMLENYGEKVRRRKIIARRLTEVLEESC